MRSPRQSVLYFIRIRIGCTFRLRVVSKTALSQFAVGRTVPSRVDDLLEMMLPSPKMPLGSDLSRIVAHSTKRVGQRIMRVPSVGTKPTFVISFANARSPPSLSDGLRSCGRDVRVRFELPADNVSRNAVVCTLRTSAIDVPCSE